MAGATGCVNVPVHSEWDDLNVHEGTREQHMHCRYKETVHTEEVHLSVT